MWQVAHRQICAHLKLQTAQHAEQSQRSRGLALDDDDDGDDDNDDYDAFQLLNCLQMFLMNISLECVTKI